MQYAGLDIGGANLKFATLNGAAKEIVLPIWQDKHRLKPALQAIATGLAEPTLVGVTMTAELADCFSDKAEGVEFIVDAVTTSFPNQDPLFYRTDGRMCDSLTAVAQWKSVAASNWHALAWLAFLDSDSKSGFVFDIGSTTSDIIPVESGQPVVPRQTDLVRLANGQLFYAGVGRTPICGLVQEFNLETGPTSIAREVFATMDDVCLWLELAQPDPTSSDTADGRPRTKQHAGQRLARMVCADFEELRASDIDAIANQSKQNLADQLVGAFRRVRSDHPTVPLNFKTYGRGSWLAEEVILAALVGEKKNQSTIVPLSEDPIINQTAAAFAVAKKREQVHLELDCVRDG